MIRDDANDGEGVLEWFSEYISKEIDSMGKNIGVLAYEDYFIFEHHQGPDIEEALESKHAQDRVYPFSGKECFTLVPIAHERKLLLVYQSQLIFFVEVYFLEL